MRKHTDLISLILFLLFNGLIYCIALLSEVNKNLKLYSVFGLMLTLFFFYIMILHLLFKEKPIIQMPIKPTKIPPPTCKTYQHGDFAKSLLPPPPPTNPLQSNGMEFTKSLLPTEPILRNCCVSDKEAKRIYERGKKLSEKK